MLRLKSKSDMGIAPTANDFDDNTDDFSTNCSSQHQDSTFMTFIGEERPDPNLNQIQNSFQQPTKKFTQADYDIL